MDTYTESCWNMWCGYVLSQNKGQNKCALNLIIDTLNKHHSTVVFKPFTTKSAFITLDQGQTFFRRTEEFYNTAVVTEVFGIKMSV